MTIPEIERILLRHGVEDALARNLIANEILDRAEEEEH